MVEKLGSESLIYAHMASHNFIVKTNEKIDRNLQSLNVYIDTKNLYLFSAKDEKLII